MATPTGTFEWETVAIPLVKGVDLNTRARLVDAGTLLKAENVYFPRGGGPEKRRGHAGYIVRDDSITGMGNPPADNLYGYGLFDSSSVLPTGGLSSDYDEAGDILELMTRDDEVLAWDGHRLYSHFSNGRSKKIESAFFPTCTTESIAKIANTQNYSDGADNGVIRVVAYVKFPGPTAEVKVYDSVTGALKFTHTSSVPGPAYVRVVNCGAWVHVIISDITTPVVHCLTIHQDDNGITSQRTLNTCDVNGAFDVWKFDESKFIVASVAAGVIYLTWVNANGTVNVTTLSQNFVPNITAVPLHCVVAVHPVTNVIGLVWDTGAATYYRAYDSYGSALFSSVLVQATNEVNHLAIAPSYVNDNTSNSRFYVYYDAQTASLVRRTVLTAYLGNTPATPVIRYNVTLASRAFRVGNAPFVWCVYKSTLQTSYVLMDRDVYPVGKIEYGTGKENIADISWLPSVNCIYGNTKWDITDFHGTFLYNRRIDLEEAGTGTTFAETSTKFYNLNFLPKLSWTQAGRCLYIAGAQVWSYDGKELAEGNFHFGVENENIVVLTSNAAGALTNSGVYRWRVDLCHQNAHGEEVRSISFLTNEYTLGAADDTAAVTIKHPPSRRTNAYYLVYRNESTQDTWYLTSNRDPQSAPAYSDSAASVTFTDLTADSALTAKEQHPANNEAYLQPLSAPSCELIAYGRDRLWISGGELLPGELHPSRLFYPGQVPSFSLALAIQIDRNNDPITGIAFQSDHTVVFKNDTTYIVSGQISNNIFTGVTPEVQLALSESGCINPHSIARLTQGIIFESKSGIKILGPGGGTQNIGTPINTVRGTICSALVVRDDDHVRFYQSDADTLVMDYKDGIWSTFVFNNKPRSAIINPSTGLAVIAVDNRILFEDETSTGDGDYSFYYTIKTAWLADKIGGFQRVRRLYCVGELEGTPPPVVVRIYKNGNDYYSEQFSWQYLDTSGYGDGDWGSGLWGDTNTSYYTTDRAWKWRKRFKKQKCESVSIEMTDNGLVTPSSKWVPIAIALEIGRKAGLERMTRTFVTADTLASGGIIPPGV
jgi:hypothetical protein